MLSCLAEGGTVDDIVRSYPFLYRQAVIAAIEYAAECMREPLVTENRARA